MANSVPLFIVARKNQCKGHWSFFDKDPMTFSRYQRVAFYKTLLNLRKRNVALSADASFKKVSVRDDKAVYAFVREKGKKSICNS